jgi:pimeloyl-CoA synthetase
LTDTANMSKDEGVMANVLPYITDRLSETSTWRGALMLLTAVGLHIDPSQSDAIIATGLSLVGLINVFRKEKK